MIAAALGWSRPTGAFQQRTRCPGWRCRIGNHHLPFAITRSNTRLCKRCIHYRSAMFRTFPSAITGFPIGSALKRRPLAFVDSQNLIHPRINFPSDISPRSSVRFRRPICEPRRAAYPFPAHQSRFLSGSSIVVNIRFRAPWTRSRHPRWIRRWTYIQTLFDRLEEVQSPDDE